MTQTSSSSQFSVLEFLNSSLFGSYTFFLFSQIIFEAGGGGGEIFDDSS
jgi:hypothetical protein